jgi:hypothetical protein
VAWVLTRTTDYDSAAEIKPGTLVSITSGTVNAGASWYETSTVVTVGTDPINFSVFFSPAGYLQKANNLSDVASTSTSRTNLGLGSIATHPTTDFILSSGTVVSGNLAAYSGSSGTALFDTGLSSENVQTLAFVNQTTTPVTMAINTSYYSNTSAVAFTLPSTCPAGAQFEVRGNGGIGSAGNFSITPAGGQTIVLNGETMSPALVGFGGTIVTLKCISDTLVQVTSLIGIAGQIVP